MDGVQVRVLQPADIAPIAGAFAAVGSKKPAALYERYLAEQRERKRVALVASVDGVFAGYLTVQWDSEYPQFRQAGIPEVTDLNVLPDFRHRGNATTLMDEAERRIRERSPVAGIGFGLHADYGAAQRMYVRRGYVPDGRGLYQNGRRLAYGDRPTVDDDLVIYLTKQL